MDRVQADGYPPLVFMFTLHQEDYSIIHHDSPCDDLHDAAWQHLWIKDYDILRRHLDVVEEMFLCAERWPGLAVGFDMDKFETIDVKDSDRS